MTTLFINGKFLAQRTTGVQRFAYGVLTALDFSLQLTPCGRDVELLLPPGATAIPQLQVIRQRVVGRANQSLTTWEQLVLPKYVREGILLCLSGSAPLLVNNCIPTIHDAAVYLYPKAYSRVFVAWYRLIFASRAKRSPLVLTVSESSARDLVPYLPPTAYRVVPNSAEHIAEYAPDTTILNRFGLIPRRYMLAVGSLNSTKNFPFLIDAYVESSLIEQLPLVIVGAMNREVFRSHPEISDNDNIFFVGSIPDAQLRALYENAAVFVFPSLYEGFGIPPLEAMFCGCPVVASNISSIAEVCGSAACYFDPKNPKEMLGAIQSVIQDDNYRNALVKRGYKRARNFTWESSAKRLRSALVEFDVIDR
ncbi:glycosyltransferase family 4 protein [Comamonas aquatica]|uniref:Glycosyltransferase family 4 protein n=1 Tax=Comamonas aquatica TaxID=225991 RepID=A0AA42W679_9BURK|nr:glycosyltransferase family 1 protein [Comamonas aquatica]MDH1429839.1 glycosyltransferase family 4 protein [Comamonas aquatica]MDH1607481.1 glycosyltransferase family 4 protein [Comamonas aquatica]MDH1619204.1 glycosyltransferase family 4 protein [Comamonas aquatica]MDH2007188.1 glycosyltransferase family 4 protein [Comamonas aquatica]